MMVVSVISYSFSVFAKERVEVNKKGEVRVVKEEKWRPLSKEEMAAFKNPGKEIPIDLRPAKPKRVDFFHYVPIQKYSKVIVFKNGKLQTVEKSGKIERNKTLAPHVNLFLTSILLMTFSSIQWKALKIITLEQIKKGRNNIILPAFFSISILISTAIAGLCVLLAAVILFTTPTSILATFCCFAIIAILITAIDGNYIAYKISTIIFYICSLTALVTW